MGVTAHLALVTSELVPILVAVAVSSAIAMAVSGLLIQGLAREEQGDNDAV